MITLYFERLKKEIQRYEHITASVVLEEKIYSDEKGFFQGQIYFVDESSLEFAEVKNTAKPGKVKYRYHYMDKDNSLIFR